MTPAGIRIVVTMVAAGETAKLVKPIQQYMISVYAILAVEELSVAGLVSVKDRGSIVEFRYNQIINYTSL